LTNHATNPNGIAVAKDKMSRRLQLPLAKIENAAIGPTLPFLDDLRSKSCFVKSTKQKYFHFDGGQLFHTAGFIVLVGTPSNRVA
jgi:hypothetical protein